MKKLDCLFLFMIFMHQVHAQAIIRQDPEIEKMAGEISADSLRSYIHTLVGFGTRHTLSSTSDKEKGIGAARNWVIGKFKSFAFSAPGKMHVELDQWTIPADGKRVDVTADMGNAMAVLQGMDTADKRIFIISGHLDSRVSDVMNRVSDAPGANDDGSGVAAMLECARVLSKHRFPATILFVAVCGEEQGLLGSDHLAERASREHWNIEGMLNNDIIGGNNSNESGVTGNMAVRIFSEGLPAAGLDKKAATIRQLGAENDGASRQLARYIKETGERYIRNLDVVLIYRNDRFLRGGDHIPFVDRGFSAIRITEMNENYDHQHQDIRLKDNQQIGDLPQFMDFEYLRKNACLNLVALANLAKSPGSPQEVSIEVKSLSNATQLNWKASRTGLNAGYYVLIRETTAAQWQKKIFTAGTEIRLPLSKDNYFFAVQSVSQDGNESIPVIPSVAR